MLIVYERLYFVGHPWFIKSPSHGLGKQMSILLAIISAAVGGVMSLLTTWLGFGRWAAEQRHQRRAQLVDRWRKELIEGWAWGQRGLPDLLGKDAYASLAVHLPKNLRRDLEGTDENGRHRPRTLYARTQGDESLRIQLMEEIGKIEMKWKLV